MNISTKDKNSDFEIAAIALLNADLNRTDYAKVSTAPAVLAQVVGSAIQGRNRFQLCRQIAQLARGIHNPRNARIQVSITDALTMLISASEQPNRKPAGRAVTVEVAA